MMINLTDMKTVRSILSRHGFHFSKKLGQNFLVDPSVCPRIAEEGNAAPGFGVLEIGPGIGTLDLSSQHCVRKKSPLWNWDQRLPPISGRDSLRCLTTFTHSPRRHPTQFDAAVAGAGISECTLQFGTVAITSPRRF